MSQLNNPTATAEMAVNRFERICKWSRLFAITGAAQAAIQATGFASGILIIRVLSTHEYALYTLTTTMLGALAILADGGVASGVMSQGGRVWKNRQQLGSVLATGMALRKKFAVVALIFAVPVFVALLRKHDASWAMTFILVATLIPAFVSALSNSLLEIVPKLHQDVGSLQLIQMKSSLVRLLINATTLLFLPFAGIAVLAAGIAQTYGNFQLWRKGRSLVDLDQSEDEEIRSEILRVVKRVLPAAIYYTLSCQVVVWVLSVFGTTQAVAEVGALSRLVMVLSVFNMACGVIIVPRFARSIAGRNDLRKNFLIVQAGLCLVATTVVFYVWQFPSHPLLLLGEQYSDLHTEVVWMSIGGVLSMVNHCNVSICNGRAYIPEWYVSPVIGTLSLAFFFLTFELGTTIGILQMNAAIWATTCLTTIGIFFYYNRRVATGIGAAV